MSGHTPGPWFVSDDDLTTVYHRLETLANYSEPAIADCSVAAGWDGASDQETSEANARLIAAAPELLAALRLAVELLAQQHTAGAAQIVPASIRAALAKAE